MPKLLVTFFLFGLSFGWGPCLISCGPLLLSYLAGTQKTILQSIGVYLLFSLSRIFVYLVIGAFVFSAMRLLSDYARPITIISGLFLILIGVLVMVGKNIDFKLCRPLQHHFLNKDIKTVVFLGIITGLAPCAPLISLISYIGLTAQHWLQGFLFSLAFGIGTLLSPLFILTLAAGLLPRILQGSKILILRIFNATCGLIIVVLGVLLLRKVF